MKADLQQFASKIYGIQEKYCMDVPSVVSTDEFIERLVHVLFPIKDKRKPSAASLTAELEQLQQMLRALLSPLCGTQEKSADEVTEEFFAAVPQVYSDLLEEADAYVKLDPAAWSVEEVILCYPGFFAVTIYRLAHILYSEKVPVLPRIISEYAHSKTGIDIHPGASIGNKLFIDHGTGVVIGETTVIGNKVKIYQGVTLGALHVEKGLADTKRHPTIEDNVIIYAGSTILGGKTVVGHDTVIGGNVWLTNSVEPHTIVYRQPKMHFKNSKEVDDTFNYVI